MVKSNESVSKRVLVADRQPGFRRLIADTLGGLITVIEVADGHTLVEAACADRPDLIVVNDGTHIADIGGLVHSLRAQDRTAGIPIILLTDRCSDGEGDGSADHAV